MKIFYQYHLIKWVEVLEENLKYLSIKEDKNIIIFDIYNFDINWLKNQKNNLNNHNIILIALGENMSDLNLIDLNRVNINSSATSEFEIFVANLNSLNFEEIILFDYENRNYNESFYKLYCSLKDKEKKCGFKNYDFIKLPQEIYIYFNDLIDEIVNNLSSTNSVMVILSQCYMKEEIIIKNLKIKVKKAFPNFETLHLILPEEDVSENDFFDDLASQIGIEANDSFNFRRKLRDKLKSQNLFLIISEFEKAKDENRKKLSSILRALNTNYDNLKITIFGGKELEILRKDNNELSFLKGTTNRFINSPKVNDIKALYSDLSGDIIKEILSVTGGNIKLIDWLVERKDKITDYANALEKSNELRLLFKGLKGIDCDYAKDLKISTDSILDNNEILNKLFWNNLLKIDIYNDREYIFWRSEVILKVAKKVFRC